jgi:hypothetical protein
VLHDFGNVDCYDGRMFSPKSPMFDSPQISAGESLKISPEFIRLPKPGTRCPFTGLSRSGVNSLILPMATNGFKPPVRSVCLRGRGTVRGTRLVVFDSLIQYLRACEGRAVA